VQNGGDSEIKSVEEGYIAQIDNKSFGAKPSKF